MPLYRLLTVLLIGVCCITCSEVVAEEQKETNAYERDFKHGNDLLVLGKYQQAADKFTNCLSIDPLNEYAYFARCVCYTRLGMYDNAIDDIHLAIGLDKNNPVFYMHYAAINIQLKDYEGGIIQATKAIELKPTSRYYLVRSDAYWGNGDPEKAIEDAQKALKLNPEDILAYEQLAEMFHEQKDYQQAIKVGKSGLLKDPQNVVLLKILSAANFGLRKFKAAYDRCYQAVEFAPYDLGLHDIFIDVAVRLKNVKANELLRFVIRNDPEFLNHPSIQQQLPTYPWIRKFNASRMEFVIAMAYTDVCLEHSQKGNHKLAERMISYAIELTPSDQEYYELRARERIQNRHRCLGAIHDCIMSFKYGNRTRFPFTLSVLAFGELIAIDHEVAQLRTLSITSALSAYLMSSAL